MTIKILEPASGRRGSSIVAVDGKLRVIDDPRPVCMGYANGCVCINCKDRQAIVRRRDQQLPPQVCECARPLGFAGSGCSKCGKPLPFPQAA